MATMTTKQHVSFIDRVKATRSRLAELETNTGLAAQSGEADQELLNQWNAACRAWNWLRRDRGKRYADCTFDNYQITNDKQQRVVDKLREYAADPKNIENGVGVVLYGTKGCGKDHLLMALAHAMVGLHGICPLWVNGATLHTELKREDFDDPNRPSSLVRFGNDPRTAPILWVSDPLPPSGALSEYQQKLILEVIDRRYSSMLPTWTTMNVASGSEAEERLGAQAVDRLCHGSLVLACGWKSYRTVGEASS
ncbi:ATP-binding protein [Roseimaritima sediminicola]|uniref:ATP-binding protein n=1 Tax=Roseimaritima sediminicola TaxID=2662066 RepID=UPI0012982504|nr:ATP-binding protein [Roseimaritima sediminicola]